MKTIIGILMIIAGIALGFYLGVIVCFIGGIITIINEFKADATNAWWILWGLTKVVVSVFIGIGSGMILIIPGANLIKDN